MQNTIVPSESFKRELTSFLEAALDQTYELTSRRDLKVSRTGENIKSLLDDCLEYIHMAHVSEGDEFSGVVYDGMTVMQLIKQSLMTVAPDEAFLGAASQSAVRISCDPMVVVLRRSSFLAVTISALCLNALQAVKDRKDGAVSVSFAIDGGLGRFLIEDNGPGLPKEVLDRLFPSMFERASRNDAPRECGGIEEAIRAVRSIGGKMVMKRTGPTGTLFSVSIPIGHFAGPPLRKSNLSNPLRVAASGTPFVTEPSANRSRPNLTIVMNKNAAAK